MPVWLGMIAGLLIQLVGTLVGRVLVSLGLGYVTYKGVDTGITWARDLVFSNLGALPGNVTSILGVLKVGTSVSIVTSALLVRASLAGLVGGAKRLVAK